MRLSWVVPPAIVLATALAVCASGLLAQSQSRSQAGSEKLVRTGDGIRLPAPPPTEADPATDNYFGTRIVDNYRWLEDGKSEATRAWLDEQNAYTDRYMKLARARPEILDEVDGLARVASWSLPMQRAEDYFFEKRLAGEEQASIYVRHGWASQPPGSAKRSAAALGAKMVSDAGKDVRLVDPSAISRDANTSVELLDVTPNAELLAYGARHGGADEQEIRFLNVKTGKTYEDTLPVGRYESVNLAFDGSGVYYCRFTRQGTLLFFHRFGALPGKDTLLFGREFNGELLGEMDLVRSSLTGDGRYLVLHISRGVPARRVDICFRDLRKPGSPFVPLIWGFDARFTAYYAPGTGGREDEDGQWYVETDYKAPAGRILKAYAGLAPESWETVVPEGPQAIEGVSLVGGKLFVRRLKDARVETDIYSLRGKLLGAMPYANATPGADAAIGVASGLTGWFADRYGFYSFQSLIAPPALYRYDTATGKQEVFAQPRVPFDSSQYELRQVFYASKDGTRIPMFVAGKRGLPRDGSARLLMTGYGGFHLSQMPAWSPLWAAWMEQGGWFALPNLRGGGEYGEAWHEQGMFEKKQNVFDDWFAAAEFLIAQRYTAPAHLAISGRSNGGLLMGASFTQRPDLFAAVWCGYPLLDMLRYQKFLFGRLWTTEYGSADNPKDFAYLRKYSPYQNVKAGERYPAILFFSGDNDTRVDPLHARKMTALLQASSAGSRPILLRCNLAGGHSAGVSIGQLVEDYADQLTFLWTETSGK